MMQPRSAPWLVLGHSLKLVTNQYLYESSSTHSYAQLFHALCSYSIYLLNSPNENIEYRYKPRRITLETAVNRFVVNKFMPYFLDACSMFFSYYLGRAGLNNSFNKYTLTRYNMPLAKNVLNFFQTMAFKRLGDVLRGLQIDDFKPKGKRAYV